MWNNKETNDYKKNKTKRSRNVQSQERTNLSINNRIKAIVKT